MNRSPLRYPGGKSNITPLIKSIIQYKNPHGANEFTYIEPFAGGAGVAINLLLEGVVTNIVVNDYDKAIYSFWRALKEETGALVEMIARTPVTVQEWHAQRDIYLSCNRKYSLELGFAAFFLNRTNRSGILNAGPIGGYEQSGLYQIDARYSKDALIDRIEKIARYKKNILVYNKEIRKFISQIIPHYGENAFVYFDPPYFAKGKRLYKNFLVYGDHVEIAHFINQSVHCDWLLTYDDAPQIREIYSQYDYTTMKFSLNYSVANKGKGTELVIFKYPELLPKMYASDATLKRLEISTF